MGCNCGGASNHEHAMDGPDLTSLKSMFSYIILPSCSALNVKKPYSLEKLLTCKNEFIQSDLIEDETQIIIKISFSGNIKLKAISLAPSECSKLQVWVNDPSLSFNNFKTPAQEWNLVQPCFSNENINYPTKISKFSSVHHLTLLFSIEGYKKLTLQSPLLFLGEFLYNRVGVVHTVYESKPLIADHRAKNDKVGQGSLIG